jgi:hypothetical protein
LDNDYDQMMCDFLCSLGLPEGCLPVERWTDIVQALSDFPGYTVVLRSHVLESVPEGLQLVGHQDALTATPMLFVVTDKYDCCKHITTEDN